MLVEINSFVSNKFENCAKERQNFFTNALAEVHFIRYLGFIFSILVITMLAM